MSLVGFDDPPPFGPAVVRRSLPIDFVVEERNAVTGAVAAKNVSAARYTYKLRVWESDDDASPLFDVTIAKHATLDSSGVLRYDFPCGATAYPDPLGWEIVEVDNNVDDADSITGKVEVIKRPRWKQPILEAP